MGCEETCVLWVQSALLPRTKRCQTAQHSRALMYIYSTHQTNAQPARVRTVCLLVCLAVLQFVTCWHSQKVNKRRPHLMCSWGLGVLCLALLPVTEMKGAHQVSVLCCGAACFCAVAIGCQIDPNSVSYVQPDAFAHSLCCCCLTGFLCAAHSGRRGRVWSGGHLSELLPRAHARERHWNCDCEHNWSLWGVCRTVSTLSVAAVRERAVGNGGCFGGNVVTRQTRVLLTAQPSCCHAWSSTADILSFCLLCVLCRYIIGAFSESTGNFYSSLWLLAGCLLLAVICTGLVQACQLCYATRVT